MRVEVLKFDNLGRGIGYINDKIIFIPKSVPGDILNVEITKEKKNYLEGKILEIISPSKKRIEANCPYFSVCGGCDLLHISLSDALEYKLEKVNAILKKQNINYEVTKIIKSSNQYNYRNKVSLKIENGLIGYYENNTHKLVNINYCFLCNKEINELIKDLTILNLKNGSITIRCNYNNELLIIITSKDMPQNIDKLINKYKIVGIIQNDQVIYGENYLVDKIDKYLFKVSFDAFFQVNPFMCSELFKLISKYTLNSQNVIDLYCGVGTLGILASNNAKHVLGVEIIENAIVDANLNKSFNNAKNIEFICADTKNIIDKITNMYDTIILDPPRSGVIESVIAKIMQEKIPKIIYVSCNPDTLARDLKILTRNYDIIEMNLMDMFPNSEHVESVVLLSLKS